MKLLLLNSIIEMRSTGQIMSELYNFLVKQGHQVLFCYGRGADSENRDFVRIDSNTEVYIHGVLSRVTGLQGYFSNGATKRLINIVKEFAPDAVILGNIHGYYLNAFRFLGFLKENKIPTYYYMFDEHAFLGKCAFFDSCDRYLSECKKCPKKKGYPASMIFDTSTKIFRDKMNVYTGFDDLRFVSVPYTVSRAKDAALFKKSNAVVYPFGWGIDTNAAFVPCNTEALRKRLNIPTDNKVVLAVAPFSNPRKGIEKYYYSIAESLIGEKISFVHVGFDGNDNDKPQNVTVVPFVKEQKELAEYFSMADLFVIPSISEGYPTVCLDALSCGTPICGFDISGTPYVAPEPYGKFAKPFDVEELKNIIVSAQIKDDTVISSCRKYAQDNLDSAVIFGKLLNQIKEDLSSRG